MLFFWETIIYIYSIITEKALHQTSSATITSNPVHSACFNIMNMHNNDYNIKNIHSMQPYICVYR